MNRHLAGIAILTVAACSVLIGACGTPDKTRVKASLTHDRAEPAADLEQIVNETYNSMFSLMTPLYLFYAQNERWPSSGQELLGMSQQLGLTFDLSRYSQLELRELQDGSLLVHFQLWPPGQGGGDFVLGKPEFEDEKEPLFSHDTRMI